MEGYDKSVLMNLAPTPEEIEANDRLREEIYKEQETVITKCDRCSCDLCGDSVIIDDRALDPKKKLRGWLVFGADPDVAFDVSVEQVKLICPSCIDSVLKHRRPK